MRGASHPAGISRHRATLLGLALGGVLVALGIGAAHGRVGVHPKTRRVSVSSAGAQGDGSSGGASISADGRFVAFPSNATNLVGGDTNGFEDVFVRGPLR